MDHATDESAVADRLVVSYRAADTHGEGHADLSDNSLVHERITDRQFSAYLRRVHGGTVTEGDEWSEFVNTGCGTTTDVVLRVESVEGGSRFTDATEIDLVPADERDTDA